MKEYIMKQKQVDKKTFMYEQVQEIVRCKDCKYGNPQMGEIYCDAHEEIGYDPEPTHPLEWFCADGERKDGDQSA